ncbi:MAG: ATP-dependent DNA helicase [Candidatus Shapirobacteria bacterium]|nr:ATP-dependent DNA helicase [Candidatus Shapirobacteria bacterium]
MTDFISEYKKLNPEQKLAVDTIDGPVMVIAGAGTGKTQTIALRIGKILTDTQTNPSNILCLTFTENAALNMRQRLLSLIGPASYGVRICTFHAFCNGIIKDNPQYFLFSKKESIPLNDVKQIQITRQLIDDLPGSSPLKNLNFSYFYQKDIIRSLTSLKKENITPDKFSGLIDLAVGFVKQATPVLEKLSAIRATPKAEVEVVNLIYQLSQVANPLYQSRLDLFLKLFQSGASTLSVLKKNVIDFVTKTSLNLPKLKDLLTIYRGYQQALIDQNLYDYDDMILWVINAFKTNPELLSQYQEQYQYILVDEFQDTNSSQYEIINSLIKDQELPNIFVVGDDDQSIYRFQGASVENVYSFYKQFETDLKIIVLKNNYRSHKLILDTSNQVISHNLNRITHYIDNLDKSLTTVSTFDPDPINLFTANSTLEESHHVAATIRKLIDTGTKPPEIAVLYRNNADITDLLPHLQRQKIKYLLSDAINILDTLEIQQLLTLFRYIFDPDNTGLYAQVLSFKFININSLTLYKIFHHQINPDKLKSIRKFHKNLAYVSKIINNSPADEVFNEIIRRFGYLDYILAHSRFDVLKQLNALYSHLKSALQIEKITLAQWMANLSILIEDGLNLNSLPLLADQDVSIRLMTVHKAKGLEFEHVFLYKVLSGKWDSSTSRSLIKLPFGIVKTDLTALTADADLEEDRRLFYVALTRAKNQIYLSYSRFHDSGRQQLPSVFINEINPELIEEIKSTSDSETTALSSFFSSKLPQIASVNLKSYLNNYLTTQYRFNITHLNSYLRCPLCFFFKTILRLPQAKTKSLSFGTSVHGALAYLYQYHAPENKFLEIFARNLQRENLTPRDLSDLLEAGKIILSEYYSHYQTEFNSKCLIEKDFKNYNVRLDGIPLTGKIDKMEILAKNFINVVDYKTGKPDSKYQELSPDGDYFRQLVFYKILCSHAHGFEYKVKSGTIDFIQPNAKGQYVRKNFDITIDAETKLTAQIKDIYKKILHLDFAPAADCPDPDHLHYLFDKYFK